MPPLLLRAADRKAAPWKNGGGITREILVMPPDAGLSDFDWRVSIAEVSSNGPFSLFPDIDRTLTILSGDGISLTIDGAEVALTTRSAPYEFPGDLPASADLLGSTVTDLNVMSRRCRFTHRVQALCIGAGLTPAIVRAPSLLVWIVGTADIRGPGFVHQPEPQDALYFAADCSADIIAENDVLAYWVSFALVPSRA
jgi:environmental stress-induced protein Ves